MKQKMVFFAPMRGGRVYGHDDVPLDGPARCPVCGRQARVFRRTLFDGTVCRPCAESVRLRVGRGKKAS